MRLGWIVPPPDLLRAMAETKRDDDFGTGMLEQHALASWLECTRLRRAVDAVLAEGRSLTAAAIPGGSDHPWHLTSADWPAATEDFYSS